MHFAVDNDAAPIGRQHFVRAALAQHPWDQLVVPVFVDCPIAAVDIDDCNGLDYLQPLANSDIVADVDCTVRQPVAQVDIEILLKNQDDDAIVVMDLDDSQIVVVAVVDQLRMCEREIENNIRNINAFVKQHTKNSFVKMIKKFGKNKQLSGFSKIFKRVSSFEIIL